MFGNLRANNAAPNKRWKSTLYCSSFADVKRILFTLCSIVEELFDEQLLSTTQNRNL